MKKKILLWAVFATLIFVLTFAFGVGAAAQELSGNCGENATWSYDSETKILNIGGIGEIYDFDDGEHTNPFVDFCEDVQTVTVENGITTVGNAAFGCMPSLETVSLPQTVTDIGKYAFCYDGSLAQINFPSSLKEIHTGAFCGCISLQNIILNEGLTAVAQDAFYATYGENIVLPTTLTTVTAEDGDKKEIASTNIITMSLVRRGMTVENHSRQVCVLADTYVNGNALEYYRLWVKSLCTAALTGSENAEVELAAALTDIDENYDGSVGATDYAMLMIGQNAGKTDRVYYLCGRDSAQAVLCENSGLGYSDIPDDRKSCGDCVFWLWYEDTSLLKVVGKGNINDYETVNGFNFPWKQYDVKKAEIESGVKGNVPFECEILGHDVRENDFYDSDCTEIGFIGGKGCITCGKVLVNPQIIPAKGHKPAVLAAQQPTCTTSGLTEGSYCTVCRQTIVPQQTIAALGHTDADGDGVCDTCGQNTDGDDEEITFIERIKRFFTTFIDKLISLFRRFFS